MLTWNGHVAYFINQQLYQVTNIVFSFFANIVGSVRKTRLLLT